MFGANIEGGTQKLSFEKFSKKYSFYIPEAHRNFFSVEDMQNFLRARYEFYCSSTSEIKIEVFNPDSKFLWLVNASVIEVQMPDSPFIVDTILDYCKSKNYNIELLIHPVFSVDRRDGILHDIEFSDAGGTLESYVYLEINRLDNETLVDLKNQILSNLKELRRVVLDYEKMLPEVLAVEFADQNRADELTWLVENFVLLGLSGVNSENELEKHYGVLRQAGIRKNIEPQLFSDIPDEEESIIFKDTEIRSNVNKKRHIYLAILQKGAHRLVLAGHFRYRAELELRYSIPAIRTMLEEMALELKVPTNSYMRKELYKTAQALPVGLLFTRSKKMLFHWLVKVIRNMYTTDVIFDISVDTEYNLVWTQVILPITEASQAPGKPLKKFLEKHKLHSVYTVRYELNQVQLLFIAMRGSLPVEKLESLLRENGDALFSSWSSRFRDLVSRELSGEKLINRMLTRFTNGISPDYEVHQDPEEVLHDLLKLEKLQPEDGFKVYYYHKSSSKGSVLKIYSLREANLSELIPLLTNFGFDIIREYAFPYTPDEMTRYTYIFSVPYDASFTQKDRDRIAETIEGVLNGKITSRPVNELVPVAGLNASQLRLMKALCTYLYKISTAYSYSSIQKTSIDYPQFIKSLVHLFECIFAEGATEKEVSAARRAVGDCFANLKSVTDEGICQGLLSVVNAVVRTNYFLEMPEISFKIKSNAIENIPHPAPYFEIYVYSNKMEGIHLRGGPVARGGIRWSDRPDDFRTEVLGLMKAQMVKNTVIVPVGSKGGFVIKNRSFQDRAAFVAAGKETYKRFISCLLDLTDNISETGEIIPAKGIKRLDGDDPYLVVAADKGTASFSDLANEISLDRKFWLTDAFASGGSVGYDHKKQGITARGTWQSVKRHFHETGVNPEQDKIRVVGIGDMGGDVFGNGMLLSKSMQLIAAFNHLYIFIDPNPDPDKSYNERLRLFEAGGNWDEYDTELISAGGGVFDRGSRRILLTKEIKDALGVKTRALSGEDLIKAILKAPVDLLWNGGIGTYVKAGKETQYQVDDSANDRVRIDAKELRAKVIGEGGNLGLTQAARIEATNGGVRINTDAIDNSAGVNMSDHEVNIKILLDTLQRKGRITYKERNSLIRKCEEDEIKLVLEQNYMHNLGLSLDSRRVPTQFLYFRALIRFLNQRGLLNRELDDIPFEADLENIEKNSRKLPRPILCSLAGFSKLYGTELFLTVDEFKDPWYDRYILRYFPETITKSFYNEALAHPLKEQIVITEILNEIVSFAGIVFFQRMYMYTGQSSVEIARVYCRVAEFLNLNELRSQICVGSQWLHSDIHYLYLLQLEEKIYAIVQKALRNKSILNALFEEDAPVFRKMLHDAAKFSGFRLPRKLRALVKMYNAEENEKIMTAFRMTDNLQDTFNIYVSNKVNNNDWQITDFFGVLQQWHIREIRQIVSDLNADSTWEIRFFSKIEQAIETLISKLMQLKSSKKSKQTVEINQRMRNVIADIIEQHDRSSLSAAGFYEMLNYLNERI